MLMTGFVRPVKYNIDVSYYYFNKKKRAYVDAATTC